MIHRHLFASLTIARITEFFFLLLRYCYCKETFTYLLPLSASPDHLLPLGGYALTTVASFLTIPIFTIDSRLKN